MLTYLTKEKEREIKRKDQYLKIKVKFLNQDEKNLEKSVVASDAMNY